MLKTGECLNRRKYLWMSLKTKLTINYSVSACLLLWSFYFFALGESVIFLETTISKGKVVCKVCENMSLTSLHVIFFHPLKSHL